MKPLIKLLIRDPKFVALAAGIVADVLAWLACSPEQATRISIAIVGLLVAIFGGARSLDHAKRQLGTDKALSQAVAMSAADADTVEVRGSAIR
jgi:small basic protein